MNDDKHPHVEDFPALAQWLDKHCAMMLWSTIGYPPHAVVQGWKINGRLVLVLLYTHAPSWDIFTAPDSSLSDQTLADAEKRLGL